MSDAQRLADSATHYLRHGPTPLTFEGLALHCGFSNFAQLRVALTNESHPEPSRTTLISACAYIADTYQRAGLKDDLNPSFIKYLLSAYLHISEKHVSESTSTSTSTSTITVQWAEAPASAPLSSAAPSRAEMAASTTSTATLAEELAQIEAEEQLDDLL